MNIYLHSFGCKVNQAEIDDMANKLGGYGFKYIDKLDQAQAVIVNTCAVTQKAQDDCERYLKKLKIKRPDLKIIATGCLAELSKERLYELGVDLVFTNNQKDGIIKNIATTFNSGKEKFIKTHTRSFIKIQDGCNCRCSYCIIPSLRGKSVSIEPNTVIDQTKNLLTRNYKEIVITGIHLGQYGRDLVNKTNLISLLTEMVKIKGDFRIRLSSMYVQDITPELINLIANEEKICQHFHISLQHLNSTILKAMGRNYGPDEINKKIEMIRRYMPDAGIGADMITAFPGETDEIFDESLHYLKNMPQELMFDYIHIFPYSKRPGTKAAVMEGQIGISTKKQRASIMREEAKRQQNIRAERLIGKRVRILTEKDCKGHTDTFHLAMLEKGEPANEFIIKTVSKVDDKARLIVT